MTFRDDLGAAQAHIQTLEARVEAERQRREAAEASQRAAEAELAEVRRGPTRPPAAASPWTARLLIALLVMGVIAAVLFASRARERGRFAVRQARQTQQVKRLRLHIAELQRSVQRARARDKARKAAEAAEAARTTKERRRSLKAAQASMVGAMSAIFPKLVQLVVRSQWKQLGSCYRRARAKAPGLGSKIQLDLSIEPSGRVSKVSVGGAEASPSLTACVAAEVKRWRFPAHDQVVQQVSIPFVFPRSGKKGF